MEDNLMPNQGNYFQISEPEEQVHERAKQKAKSFDGHAVIKDLIKHFEDRIEFYKTIDSIPQEVRGDEKLFLITVNANALTSTNLLNERDYLKSLLDE